MTARHTCFAAAGGPAAKQPSQEAVEASYACRKGRNERCEMQAKIACPREIACISGPEMLRYCRQVFVVEFPHVFSHGAVGARRVAQRNRRSNGAGIGRVAKVMRRCQPSNCLTNSRCTSLSCHGSLAPSVNSSGFHPLKISNTVQTCSSRSRWKPARQVR